MALSANKQREKEILSYIKNETKKRNWNFRGWQAFKIEKPFLVSINFSPYGKLNKLNVRLEFKFEEIDSLNCEITGAKDYFKNGPLYYKVNSFGMLFPYTYFSFEVNDVTEAKINFLVDEIEIKAIELVNNLSGEKQYYEFIKLQTEKRGNLADDRFLTSLIYLKKYEELLNTVKNLEDNQSNMLISQIDLNNPQFNEKSYYDKLKDYVNKLIDNKLNH